MKLKVANYKNHWNVLIFCDQWKIMPDLNMSHWKISDFVSFLLFRFTLVIKNYETLTLNVIGIVQYFLSKKNMTTSLNLSDGKMSDFVLFPLSGFPFAGEIRTFSNLQSLIFQQFELPFVEHIWIFLTKSIIVHKVCKCDSYRGNAGRYCNRRLIGQSWSFGNLNPSKL